jgi:hypothetical protein
MTLSYGDIFYPLPPASVPRTQPLPEATYQGISYKLDSNAPLAPVNALTLWYCGVPYSLDPNPGQLPTDLKSYGIRDSRVYQDPQAQAWGYTD